MKKTKRFNCFAYLLCLIKILCTVLVPFLGMKIAPFSIITVWFCFASAYDSNLVATSTVLLIVTATLWMATLFVSMIGIRSLKARKASLMFIIIIFLIDFVVSFLVSSEILRIPCIIFSLISLMISLISFLEFYVNRCEKIC